MADDASTEEQVKANARHKVRLIIDFVMYMDFEAGVSVPTSVLAKERDVYEKQHEKVFSAIFASKHPAILARARNWLSRDQRQTIEYYMAVFDELVNYYYIDSAIANNGMKYAKEEMALLKEMIADVRDPDSDEEQDANP